ncbi:hydroxyacylglutathione hydrolase [Lonsdalea quercina]|uniref:hydroxyacylglutathione hydrolase n=1 Tax=Lonsdalea quercina TaxID=71657 RepID=UPI003975C17D
MNLISVPALKDNYIWLLCNRQKQCVIVDPGEAAPVLTALDEQRLTPIALLLTHHHQDHVGGVKALVERFPHIDIYGPQETSRSGTTHIVKEDDKLTLLNSEFSIFSVPGHTAGHIAYYSAPYLFCGDTLFSAGCGRIFEGTPEQMFESVSKLNQLPDETLVCCAHEYTVSNLEFAHGLWPEEPTIADYLLKVRQLREKGLQTVPTSLGFERNINLFLRCHDTDLQRKIFKDVSTRGDWQTFAQLRAMKDHF